jgi:hypothetical protein
MTVGADQAQPGAPGGGGLFLSFKSPSIYCPCHHNLAIVLKTFLKPRRSMSFQGLPYIYVGELVRMIWCPCHYLIDPRSFNLKEHPIYLTEFPKFL